MPDCITHEVLLLSKRKSLESKMKHVGCALLLHENIETGGRIVAAMLGLGENNEHPSESARSVETARIQRCWVAVLVSRRASFPVMLLTCCTDLVGMVIMMDIPLLG